MNYDEKTRELLKVSLKWIRRIEERKDDLPESFLDNTDIVSLRKEIEAHLNKTVILWHNDPNGEP